ncbi:MAG: carboxypeptidase regulatory-like domain-containing protein [Rhodothermales bacterium]|nr:carboxypeptidase regulatory-like domain-containing protein [Rhodothermales bacterium]
MALMGASCSEERSGGQASAFAEEGSSVRVEGRITDVGGAGLPRVNVQLTSTTDSTRVIGVATGPEGTFWFSEVPVDTFVVRIARYPDVLIIDTLRLGAGQRIGELRYVVTPESSF